jgi:2-polyprenyl-3-methyl-5-hydroxy-6-metoxy-1,4-benzoquinol methylase
MDHCCCICRDPKNKQFYRKIDGFELLRCPQCKLIFSSTLPQSQNDFFKDSLLQENEVEYWSTPNLYETHTKVFIHFFQQRLERLKKHGIASGTILDIGTGYGFWSDYLQKQGFRVKGVEITKNVAAYARERYQLDVLNSSIEDYQSDEKFDAICMFDVLEHLERPDQILFKLKSMLKPNGLIYIQVPNVIGLKYPYGHSLGLPYHIWQFDPKSLKSLCTQNALKPLEYWTGIQGVIGAYERNEVDFIKKALWDIANFLKIGNRVQLICKE